MTEETSSRSTWVAHAFQGVHSSAEDESALAAEVKRLDSFGGARLPGVHSR